MKTYYLTSADVIDEGIIEVHGYPFPGDPSVLIVDDADTALCRGRNKAGPKGRAWHETREAAVAYANRVLRERIAEAEARLAHLRSLRFE